MIEASRAIVINAGTRPWVPPIAGLADTPYWTNRGAVETESVPASLGVLGGGAIGVELGQMFHRFGSEVTVLEIGPSLIGPEEPEASRLLTDIFASEGIDVRTDAAIDSIHHDGHRFAVVFKSGPPLVVDQLLVSTGRHADLAQLNVASIGLDDSARSLPVDDHMRVEGVDRMWAIGDITGKGAFTHVSMYQSDIVVDGILGRAVVPAEYRAVSTSDFHRS